MFHHGVDGLVFLQYGRRRNTVSKFRFLAAMTAAIDVMYGAGCASQALFRS